MLMFHHFGIQVNVMRLEVYTSWGSLRKNNKMVRGSSQGLGRGLEQVRGPET